MVEKSMIIYAQKIVHYPCRNIAIIKKPDYIHNLALSFLTFKKLIE